MKPRDLGNKTQPLAPPNPEPRRSTPPAPGEPRVVVNASLLDDVELDAELPVGVEVWTPGGVRTPSKAPIPVKVDLWVPDGLKGPRPGAAKELPAGLPKFRAQQPTMLLPVAKRRHQTRRFAVVSVAALIAALAMLAGVLAWRHWSKGTSSVRGESDKADLG